MRYRCNACGATEWRGFFPERTFHLRYAVFHGVAIGIAGIAVKAYFKRIGYVAEGLSGGLMSLAVAALVLLVVYGLAIAIEACVVAFLPCTGCGSRGLRLHA
jgi:hypothetical protein